MDEKVVIFDTTAQEIIRILIVGTLTYFSIILLLRASGKRTLAKMNAFDFIITVAMGSAFGKILTSTTVSYFEALTAFALLISLQFIISWLSVRSGKFKNLVTSQPRLLYYNGSFIDKNLKAERLRKDDVMSSIRSKKIDKMDLVEAIIFETNSTLSVIKKSQANGSSTYSQPYNRLKKS